ncbi:Cyclochlorotine biosynthesis protein O [Colletotrichum orbiculare MAFF 240422]|uniref:Cyclochlorotine biosynthesis protein O n=1 Tax=Colletotrichum orbiculare (strain 104-T / ATCC 96160 / CBS 514.97 / LARS 414 / MAFF 240422) TaxID=1213857 RepID=A0A484FTK5_COLOR|nr:Cyclochlorotine biosynthesis protein O [Colletotrichum orbiculare MAFF 240422]
MNQRQCIDYTSSWSPALSILEGDNPYTLRKFNGSVFFSSPYKGPPSDTVDSAWHQITHMGAFSLTEEEILKIGKDPEIAVRLPQELGGQYMGTLEVFHQLHCLNLLWQATHFEYYHELGDAIGTQKEKALRNHLDHCVDILRQNLQCTSDLGVLTYAWVDGRDDPWPDFSTQHKCRNFEKVVDWGNKRTVPLYEKGPFTKTAGAPAVPTLF